MSTVSSLTHGDPDGGYPSGLTVQSCPLVGGPQVDPATFETAVETLDRLHEQPGSTLVHCSVGASRSVSVAAAALTRLSDRSIGAAFEHVENNPPPSRPTQGWLSKQHGSVDGHPIRVRAVGHPHDLLTAVLVRTLDRTSD